MFYKGKVNNLKNKMPRADEDALYLIEMQILKERNCKFNFN